MEIQGIPGKICAPECQSGSNKCPLDVPQNVSASPTCALEGLGADKYCALVCVPPTPGLRVKRTDEQCGENASCKGISGTGICTYDQ